LRCEVTIHVKQGGKSGDRKMHLRMRTREGGGGGGAERLQEIESLVRKGLGSTIAN
jgi:hypothetical protein